MKLKYNELNLKKFEAHSLVLSNIENNKRVLDLGCATGYMGAYLKNYKDCEVWGVEMEKSLFKLAKKNLDKTFNADLRDIKKLKIPKRKFDYILLADVLEHILFYDDLLMTISKFLNKKGRIIISTPNIAHISVRYNLLFGRFSYQDKGILDKTHIHFFTKNHLLETIKRAGYAIDSIEYSSDFGQLPILGKYLRYVPKVFQYKLTKLMNKLLAVQFIVVAKPI